MPIQILMPALSPTMTEGTLAKWHVKEGDQITSGDVIAEVETDKATMEVETIDEGIVGRLLIAEGAEGVPVNQVIALLLEDGEDAGAVDGAAAGAAPAAPPPAAQAPACGRHHARCFQNNSCRSPAIRRCCRRQQCAWTVWRA